MGIRGCAIVDREYQECGILGKKAPKEGVNIKPACNFK